MSAITPDMFDYAQRIIDACDRIASANDPDEAICALEILENLTSNVDDLRLLASAFLLCAHVIVDDDSRKAESIEKENHDIQNNLNTGISPVSKNAGSNRSRLVCESRSWLRQGYITAAKVDELMARIRRHRGDAAASELRDEMRRQWSARGDWMDMPA